MDDKTARSLACSGLLDGVPRDLYGETLDKLCVQEKTYLEGELLLHLGEHPDAVGVVVEGYVRIDFYDDDGNASTIAVVGRGECSPSPWRARGIPASCKPRPHPMCACYGWT